MFLCPRGSGIKGFSTKKKWKKRRKGKIDTDNPMRFKKIKQEKDRYYHFH